MADIFSDLQATRLFAFIAAGGSTGAIAGPIITTSLVARIGPGGLLLIAAAGFLLVIAFIYSLVAEKAKFRSASSEAQKTTLDHALPGNPFRGFKLLFQSRFLTGQAAFMLLMTWVATIVYFLQTDYIAKAYTGIDSRTQAFADIDLLVNLASAAILILGSGRLVQRFGVTAGLVLSPVLMFVCFVVMAFSPTLFLVQTARGIQRVSQYAIARPSREILFTVVDQQSKYKAKNVIDTVVYRFGDVTAAWLQAGVRMAGFGLTGVVTLGILCSAAWGLIATAQGRRYESLRREQPA
jgi:AAA family ATP:ADP antiporter